MMIPPNPAPNRSVMRLGQVVLAALITLVVIVLLRRGCAAPESDVAAEQHQLMQVEPTKPGQPTETDRAEMRQAHPRRSRPARPGPQRRPTSVPAATDGDAASPLPEDLEATGGE